MPFEGKLFRTSLVHWGQQRQTTVLSHEAHLETLTRLVDTKSDLAFLDTELAKILNVLREPMALRKRLYSRILDYHAATSPQRKLPNEILSLIFTHCMTGPIHVPVAFKEAPRNTSHVCSRWRQVSLAQRDLWKNILIYFDVFLLRRWNSHFACGSMMEELLRRSSSKLISLTFAVSNGGPIKIDFDQVSNYIVDHAHRIQKLSICDEDCSDRELPRDAFDSFENVSFSALESLVVDIPIRNLPCPIHWPQLSHLEIDDRSQGFDFTALRLLLEKCNKSLLL
ncbi:hypothetical protein Hypma_003916 [Hypsizygus marmoreus]|uniref:Uncharacterized protein n=1 Tax=Hypsizygus marmoreus TaxID=39966 RepID=A0A369K6P3_HYPMA|nr:hypothetical protein Hypma_003916 [Hypsizygus marmoreus]